MPGAEAQKPVQVRDHGLRAGPQPDSALAGFQQHALVTGLLQRQQNILVIDVAVPPVVLGLKVWIFSRGQRVMPQLISQLAL